MKESNDNTEFTAVKKLYSLIGLSTKARYAASGEFLTEASVKEGRSFLVIVADDASDNTKKKFRNMCSFRELPLYIYGSKEALGHAMGNEYRASVSINNQGMAEQIIKYLEIIGRKE